MRPNVTFSIGNLAAIEKANAQFGFIDEIFGGMEGKAKTLLPSIKLLIYNRLGECHAVSRLADVTPMELFSSVGALGPISDRTLNRSLERIGQKFELFHARYQQWVKKHDLASHEQFADFTSSYFVGDNCPLGKLGYSRDSQPGNLQLNYGVCVGSNKIPTVLTIQKGNVQDKTHMGMMLKFCQKVLAKGSTVIFDCGGNTRKNKRTILKMGFHYLTLKAKKKKPYKKLIGVFRKNQPQKIEFGDEEYLCVKAEEDGEFQYIFFSKKLQKDQLRKKRAKFRNKIKKNEALLKKVRKGKEFKPQVCSEGWIITKGCLQKTIDSLKNPFITGLEGFFILESSMNIEPIEILRMYKNRDKAEKLIRDIKEGAEIRPMRHWSADAIKGHLFIIFLTSALANLTLLFAKNPLVTNLKVLKKYLKNLTLTIVYPKDRFRFSVVSNISPEIKSIFGNFIEKYGDKELGLRW